jgi:hypothetical protein
MSVWCSGKAHGLVGVADVGCVAAYCEREDLVSKLGGKTEEGGLLLVEEGAGVGLVHTFGFGVNVNDLHRFLVHVSFRFC